WTSRRRDACLRIARPARVDRGLGRGRIRAVPDFRVAQAATLCYIVGMGYENRPCRDAALKDARLLRYSVAFLWLATGLGVLHESYRSIGHDYLSRLGLPDSIMFATCAGEIVLGLWVAAGHAGTLVTVLQVGLIAGFSGILTWLEP